MSAAIYSRDALRQAREGRQPAAPAEERCIFDEVPLDAPMSGDLVIGFWADWLGEYVSWERYIATCPVERLRETTPRRAAAPTGQDRGVITQKSAASQPRERSLFDEVPQG